MRYNKHFNTNATPQSQKVPGKKKMVKNSAGGYVFKADKWSRLDRFLVLGTEGGSYYADEKTMTVDNAKCITKCMKSDGVRTVNRIVEISENGRAPKNDPAIFALAMCAKMGDDATRKAAREAIPKVCRIGTHLFSFADCVETFGGWGRGTRNAIARWYTDKDLNRLALQAAKYQQRNGWSHRDLLRLSHPKTDDFHKNGIFKWIVKGNIDEGVEAPLIHAYEKAKRATSVKEIVSLIDDFNLPRECIPTQFLKEKDVWGALLERMPMTAMVRNLGNMSKCDLLTPLSKASKKVVSQLDNVDVLRKSRIHPIQILTALLTYKAGKSVRGSGTWKPVGPVVDALDRAFYAAFGNVESTGKNILFGLDISGSMWWGGDVAGVPGLSPALATAAMALVTANVEPNHMFGAFTTNFREITISPRQRLDDVMKTMHDLSRYMGGTDCAQPVVHAQKKGYDVDAFIICTDNASWAGEIHVFQALDAYRKKTNIPAKLVNVSMVANQWRISDPSDDAGSLDVVGFDTATPNLISQFISD